MARRIRFRSPGVKPGQRIGPLGPFRGRLGLQWVIAPLVLGGILAVAAWLYLRPEAPSPPWRPAGGVASFPVGRGREALPGVFVGRLDDGRLVAVVPDPGCPLEVTSGGYRDCEGRDFSLHGIPRGEGNALDLVPVRIYDDVVYANPDERIER